MSKDIKQIECDEAIQMVLEYLDNELANHDHDALESHIDKCRSCYTRVEFEKRLKGMVSEKEEPAVPENLKERLKKLTDQF